MPYNPDTKTFDMPMQSARDVEALFDEANLLSQHPSPSRREWAARALEDVLLRLGVVHPEWVRPLHPRFARLTDAELGMFRFRLSTWLFLLQGADDAVVDALVSSLKIEPKNDVRLGLLAAICTPFALERLGEHARQHRLIQSFEEMGFEIPLNEGAAQPRFTIWRRAIREVPLKGERRELANGNNSIGLPLADVVKDVNREEISWHYLTLDISEIEGLPELPFSQLHLLSPPVCNGWTLYCDILSDSRYSFRALELDKHVNEDFPEEWDEELKELDNDQYPKRGYIELLEFDDGLKYVNGHVRQTKGVIGELGGIASHPHPNPKCPKCKRLMFHLLTTDTFRDYGDDGWRSLYFCEDCHVSACTGVPWN